VDGVRNLQNKKTGLDKTGFFLDILFRHAIKAEIALAESVFFPNWADSAYAAFIHQIAGAFSFVFGSVWDF
jgi:hypothetical protein